MLRDSTPREAGALIRKIEGEESVVTLAGMGFQKGHTVAALMTKQWLEMALVWLGAANLAEILAELTAPGVSPLNISSHTFPFRLEYCRFNPSSIQV